MTCLFLSSSLSVTSHLLAASQICAVCAGEVQRSDIRAAEERGTAHVFHQKHERQERKFSRVETFAGGDVCAAASGLCRFGSAVGSAQGAGRGAGQAGVPDAGVGTVLQAASRTAAR